MRPFPICSDDSSGTKLQSSKVLANDDDEDDEAVAASQLSEGKVLIRLPIRRVISAPLLPELTTGSCTTAVNLVSFFKS